MAAAAAEPILHVALRTDWQAAQPAGWYRISTRGHTLAQVGFVHAATREQLAGVLARFYADLDPQLLCLLVLAPDVLQRAGSPVRWEPVPGTDDGSGRPELFPHVYGPIPVGAVRQVQTLTGEDLG